MCKHVNNYVCADARTFCCPARQDMLMFLKGVCRIEHVHTIYKHIHWKNFLTTNLLQNFSKYHPIAGTFIQASLFTKQ